MHESSRFGKIPQTEDLSIQKLRETTNVGGHVECTHRSEKRPAYQIRNLSPD